MKKAFPEIKKQILAQFNDAHSTKILDVAARMMLPVKKSISVKHGNEIKNIDITRMGMGPLQTHYGEFWLFNFEVNDEWSKYAVLVKCSQINYDTLSPLFMNREELLLRIDSGCETGHIFLDNTCDCPEQLHKAMALINTHGEGIIINIPNQDGRGKGTPFKLSTLFLQKELGLNTVLSAAYLAGEEDIDVRTYYGVIGILKYLDIDPGESRINFATNNPDKKKVFDENNFMIQNMPLEIAPTQYTLEHLKAKKNHLNHKIT